jgi:hypothetical protein
MRWKPENPPPPSLSENLDNSLLDNPPLLVTGAVLVTGALTSVPVSGARVSSTSISSTSMVSSPLVSSPLVSSPLMSSPPTGAAETLLGMLTVLLVGLASAAFSPL